MAHRGASAHAPENTLEAAKLGFAIGADAWELDVHLTRDRVPVVIHDESLVRTTDVVRRFASDPRAASGYRVADFDLDEIQSLDAGSWFLQPDGGVRTAAAFGTLDLLTADDWSRYTTGSVRVPTLVDALRLTKRLDWMVNVELKSFPCADPGLIDAVLAAVDETDAGSRVLISSFDHADLAHLAESRPELATGVLTTTPLYHPEEYVRDALGCDAYHPSYLALGGGSEAYLRAPGAENLRVGDLARLAARGVPVLVYTVNDARSGGLATHLAE
ncbi:MAG: glycerophosphodiester phosphodiesterase family protein, partial [Isosphaeraceae bacterium]|nr:glycerophosphodiester phosphodiesterase family protein [Isosphaeraceae bacterium]